jgi:hypothetical protein
MKKVIFMAVLFTTFIRAQSTPTFLSQDLEKLKATAEQIKDVPLEGRQVCQVSFSQELYAQELEVEPPHYPILKEYIAQTAHFTLDRIFAVPEVFEVTGFKSMSDLIDNTYCFVNLPIDQLEQYEDRVKLLNVLLEISGSIKVAVAFEDFKNEETQMTETLLFTYFYDENTKEFFALQNRIQPQKP